MDPIITGSLITGGFNMLNSWLQGKTAKEEAELNYKLGKETLEYQKSLQQQIFEREDNAVQRRAKDLEMAGLSKTLAAGSGADAGAVVPVKTPEKHTDTRYLENMVNSIKLGLDYKAASEQIKLMQVQKENIKIENELKEQQLKFNDLKNPLTIDAMKLQNDFARATNPLQIKDMSLELQKKVEQIDILEQEKKLKMIQEEFDRLGIDMRKKEIIALSLQNEWENVSMENRLNKLTKEMLIQELTLSIMEKDADRKALELYWERIGLPVRTITGAVDDVTGAVKSTKGLIK